MTQKQKIGTKPLTKCNKTRALLMADQVPNCPPSTGFLVKDAKEHRLQLKPTKNIVFSFQYKACRESWLSRTDSNYTKPACLTHGYWRVREEERGAA